MGYRVCLLGELALEDEHGKTLEAPADGVTYRPLVALAIRPGQPWTAHELGTFAWPDDEEYRPQIAVPIARARHFLPIPRQVNGTYRTSLTRSDVDLTDFLDRINVGKGSLTPTQVDELLGLWRNDPERLYVFLPSTEFQPLRRARAALIKQLASWSQRELGELANLESFRTLFEEECTAIPVGAITEAKRVLVVDDNAGLTSMLTDLLGGYTTVVANSVRDAMAIISDPSSRIDGALVDLHLSDRLDSHGINVLDALRRRRPDVPRVLMTSSPPAEGMADFAERYGLFEILVKNGPDAPAHTRSIVEKMLSDRPEHAIGRARATLQTLAGRAQQFGSQAVVAARRRSKTGDSDGESLEDAADRLDEVESATATALDAITAAATPDEAEQVVANFAEAFSEYLPPDEPVR